MIAEIKLMAYTMLAYCHSVKHFDVEVIPNNDTEYSCHDY